MANEGHAGGEGTIRIAQSRRMVARLQAPANLIAVDCNEAPRARKPMRKNDDHRGEADERDQSEGEPDVVLPAADDARSADCARRHTANRHSIVARVLRGAENFSVSAAAHERGPPGASIGRRVVRWPPGGAAH